MKKSLSSRIRFILFQVFLIANFSLLITAVHADSANIKVNASMRLYPVSPYIFGHNTSSIYYKAPLTDQKMIDYLKNCGMKMWRFPPGQAGNRYDFKGNNYQGRYWDGGSATWTTGSSIPSLEEELAFCNAIGAEPMVEINSAFRGPQGTGRDIFLRWCGGGDFANYTGVTLPDTAVNRAKYAADMATHVRTVCQARGWKNPVYYEVGNEWAWDGQTYRSYVDCVREYRRAIKAVDPNAMVINSGAALEDLEGEIDIDDTHGYYTTYTNDSSYVYGSGTLDGSFSDKYGVGGNALQSFINGFSRYAPGREPVYSITEWGDHYSGTGTKFTTYKGAIFEAHTFYRLAKGRFFLSCIWSIWSASSGNYHMFAGPPTYIPRPRYYPFVLYSNFGNTLLECYDTSEYTPGVTDYFLDYKDDNDDLLTQAALRSDGSVSIMAINLSESTTYQATIAMDNFNMNGNITAYVMNPQNSYEGGPGPSTTTLTGQANPISYTVYPFSQVCLIVKGNTAADTSPPAQIAGVRDGTGSDLDSTYSNKILRANWDKTTDLHSGVSTYWYAIGTSAGGTDVKGWTGTKKSTSAVAVGLNLTVGQMYYFSVKAENGYGVMSVPTNSDGILVAGVDATAPVMGAVRDGTGAADTDVTYSPNELSANWDTAADPETGITKYWYAVGVTPGGTDVVNWSSTTATNVTAKNLVLNMNSNYYFSIKAENDMGLTTTVDSDGAVYTRPAVVFKDDFETWTTPPGIWDSSSITGGTLAPTTEQKKEGSKSLKCVFNNSKNETSLTKNLSPMSECFVQFNLYLSSGFVNSMANNEQIYLGRMSSSGGRTLYLMAGRSYDVGVFQIQCDGSWANIFADVILEEGRWYCVEVGAPQESSSGKFSMWIDGVQQRSISGQNLNGAGKWNKLDFGLVGASPSAANVTVYLDEVKVACAYIGSVNDNTPPTNITTIIDGLGSTGITETTSTTKLSANWGASVDPESGVVRYWYAIGTTAGGSDIAGWTDNGMNRSVTHTGLSLAAGQTYYFSAKAENWVGLQSNTISSNGQKVVVGPETTPRADVYPNPHSFKNNNQMNFQIKGADGGEVKIFTVSGKLVRKITVPAGVNSAQWDGTNEDGEKVARGIYIYAVEDDSGKKTGKFGVIK